MLDFMKTIISAVQTWVDSKIKASVADWNQNDENALNHVKNRPFYSKRQFMNIVDEQTVTVNDGCAGLSINANLEPDQTYTVYFNGDKYECTAWYSESWDCILLGNGAIGDDEFDDTGEPFYLDGYPEDNNMFVNTLEDRDVSIKIEGYGQYVHQIDVKFIPNYTEISEEVQKKTSIEANYESLKTVKVAKSANAYGEIWVNDSGELLCNDYPVTRMPYSVKCDVEVPIDLRDDYSRLNVGESMELSSPHDDGYYTHIIGSLRDDDIKKCGYILHRHDGKIARGVVLDSSLRLMAIVRDCSGSNPDGTDVVTITRLL